MQRLKDLAISEAGFVFDPYSGATFTANKSALSILECLRDGLPRGATADVLRRRFEADGEDVLRDIDELVSSLKLYGLVPASYEVAA